MLKEDFCVSTYEMRLKRLLQAFISGKDSIFFLNLFKDDALISIHEIGQALYTLLFFECFPSKNIDILQLNFTKRKTVCLFKQANFIWGALPYPAEHAELGSLLMQLSVYNEKYKETTENMLAFQQASFTHKQEIFSSLFAQSLSRNQKDVNRAGNIFLSTMKQSCLKDYVFVDEDIGFIMLRNDNASAYVSGSGCKSSLGAFLFKDIGIVSWGPHRGIPEKGEGFGISGNPLYFRFYKYEETVKVLFDSPLSSVSERETGFRFLKDSSFSLSRVKVAVEFSLLKYSIDMEFINCSCENSFFCLFCKAHVCSIIKGPRLRAYSLDSYKGPINTVVLEGIDKETLKIEGIGGEEMQIFSLPGNDTFFGANFLMLFKRNYAKIDCCFTLEHSI